MSDLNKPYVSVIKIKGAPILPPLITPELRKELFRYKQQALKLEQRLKTCRDLKANLNKLLTKSTVPNAGALNNCDKSVSKNLNLTKDLIEVTQYNSSGVKTICSNVELDNVSIPRDKSLYDSKFKYETWSRPSRSKSASRNVESSEDSTCLKPRLIRSNSYTLETPSPVLLEHLRNNLQHDSISAPVSSLEHKLSIATSSTKNHQLSTPTPKVEDIKTPTIEVYQTDISVQQITVNTTSPRNDEGKSESFFNRNPLEVMEPDSELMDVLREIPDEYAQQVIDLLKKQHIEQKKRLERYDSIKENHQGSPGIKLTAESDNLIDFTSLDDCTQISNTTCTTPNESQLRRSSTFSISPSQSMYYSVVNDSDTPTPHFAPDIVLSNGLKNLEIGVLREKNGYLEGIVRHENQMSVSRELFQELDPITVKEIKREWAASVIGAHVRGYLTRRLLNTDKVQNLIATVKDVLLCALELHQSKTIDEKDVELHRRLINQLSAALYSFHEIFFDLSVQDQMGIISADRQRRLEKIKRPPSGRHSARPRSGKSTLDRPNAL